MTGEQLMKLAMQKRTEAGLRCVWSIPEEGRTFTAYAKDEAQKAAWMADAEARGWVVLQ